MAQLENPRHERFAQARASGKTATDAYTEAGYRANDGNASKLANRPDVLARVKEITGAVTSKAIESAALDREWVLTRLMEAAEKIRSGKEFPNGPTYNRALELLGKELGMFVERKEVGKPGEFAQMSDDELDAELGAMLKGFGVKLGNGRTH